MRRIALALGALLFSVPAAYADGTIDTLSAGAALTGTEKIPMFQTANPAVYTTPSALGTYLAANFGPSVTDGTNTVSNSATISLGNGFGVSGTSPTASVAMKSPDRTQTASGGAVGTGDMAGQINLNGASLSFNVPAIGAGVWNTGATSTINDLNSTSVSLTNTATVNGCGATLYSGGFFSYTSNGTSLDCFGFPGFGWMAANAITVSTVTGKSRVVTTGTTDTLLASDCGEEVVYNLAAFTVTVPSAIVPASGSVCTIRIRTATANKVTISGSGVTVTSADSYTGTQAIAGSGISLDLTTVGATATAYLDGHGS